MKFHTITTGFSVFVIVFIVKFQLVCTLSTTDLKFNLPNELEDPDVYKQFIRLQFAISYIAKTSTKNDPANEPLVFRRLTNLLKSENKTYRHDNVVTVQDHLMKEVRVRTYRPAASGNKSIPALIFYHGGGYVFSTIEDYDYLTYSIAKEANIMVLSIDYTLAPENPFPKPLNECWIVTTHIIRNADKLGIDRDRIVIGGDSSGGHATAVIAQRLVRRYRTKKIPKAQVLIYPFLQHFNFKLPSRLNYNVINPHDDTASIYESMYWIFGITNSTKEMQTALEMNYHTLLMEDVKLKNNLENCLNLKFIPNKYKNGKSYYNSVEDMYPTNEKFSKQSILKTDKRLAIKLLKLFTTNHSPSLVDDFTLKQLNSTITYFALCEVDMFKDEGLIYSERLKQNGVPVKLNFYDSGYHGILNNFAVSKVAKQMFTDLVQFLKNEI